MSDIAKEFRSSSVFDVDVNELIEKIDASKTALAEARSQIQTMCSKLKSGTDKESGPLGGVSAARINNLGFFQRRKVLKGHFSKVNAVDWNPSNPTQLVSASQDGSIIIWNALRGVKNKLIYLSSQWVMTAAFSPEGVVVTAGGLDNKLSLYSSSVELTEGPATPIGVLALHEGYVSSNRFLTPENLVTGSGDSTCVLWDVATQTPKLVMAEHESDVMS